MNHLTLTVLSNNPAGGRCTIVPNDIYNGIKQIELEIADLSGSYNWLGYLVEETTEGDK